MKLFTFKLPLRYTRKNLVVMEEKNMEKQNRNSMDGFMRRTPGVSRQLGQPAVGPAIIAPSSVNPAGAAALTGGGGRGVRRGDLDESLRAIDTDKKVPNKNDPYRKARRRKVVKRIIVTLLIIIALLGVGFALNALIQSSKIFKGNIFEALTGQNTPLQTDSQGRTNILVFGTSEDDPGHDGANLTDSIMVLSIDQNKKTAQMLSVPRDLWVQYDHSCTVGFAGKINAVYECGLENTKKSEDAASQQFMNKVDSVLGISLQYYAHVNYTVVKDTVDAVGGIDVNIAGDGSQGIYDTNFDWNCPGGRPYSCKNVYYPTNGTYHLNGTQALYLARARADGGAYSYKDFGLAHGDFDRQANQQKILKALQTKMMSAGTLGNPVKVLGIINSLGTNLRTNFQTKEITTLINLAKTIPTTGVTSLNLTNASSPLVTTGTGPDGSSIVKPVAGLLDYSDIQAYIKAAFSGDVAATEDASVAVYNGSSKLGVATGTSTMLKNAGFNVTTVDDTTDGYAPRYTLYDTTGGKKPNTLAKLQKQLGVKPTSGTPKGITTDADFIVIVGNGTGTSQ
jgi:LCP family protein required for cell wall assembly